MHFGDLIVARIKELCKQQHITINALANIAGLTPSTVYGFLNYEIKNPRIDTLHRICEALHISLSEFYADEIFNNVNKA